ncbi:MAG: response regulator [Gallionella sp.]|jgi:PAS domain S-box-containing protein
MTGKNTILAVDDTPASLQLLVDMLTAQGYQVVPAGSGELALSAVALRQPDLILLDIGMPGMDGFEVLRRIKANEQSRDIPIIFISAFGEGGERAEGLKLGAVDFVSKPFQHEELLARVQTHLELHRLRIQLEHQAIKLARSNEQLRTELVEHERAAAALHALNREMQSSYLAALNLMDDAVEAQTRLETANEQLRNEMAGRKRVEQSLRDSEAKLNRAQAVAQLGSWNLDIASNRLEWSEEAHRIFGIPGKDVTDLDTFESTLHPDDREMVLKAWGKAVAGAPYDIEHRIVANGEIRWVRERAIIERDAEGRALSGIGTTQDISDRKMAEAVLREKEYLLSESQRIANVGSWSFELTGQLTWSDETYRIFGVSPETFTPNVESLLGQIHPDDRQAMQAWLSDCVAGNKPDRLEFRILLSDGTVRFISGFGELQYDVFKRPNKLVGIVHDITERKLAEAAVLQLNAELENKVAVRTVALEHAKLEAEQANRAKSAFLATMSHEIRTPMNGVIGMIDVLQQSGLNNAQTEMINIIRDSAFSLLVVINDILDFSKIEAGKLVVEHVPMRVAEVVEHACGMLDRMARKQAVELMIFTDPAIPEAVLGDSLRLRQVLINLVNNAIKFSGKQQQSKVSVRALLADASLTENGAEQVTVEFCISDNGIGMDETVLSELFTPFTQADVSTTRRFGGTGLGLSISYHLVELMGGRITVQSELGKGSTFTVCLPFERVSDKPAADTAESSVTGVSCLVVGDDTGGQLMGLAGDISTYLTHDGVLVERALNMGSARDLAETLQAGMWVWIIDTAGQAPSIDELRATANVHPEQKILFVTIGRGQRREPRWQDSDIVTVDGNLLTHRNLLKAVEIAAGRAKQIVPEVLPIDARATVQPLSHEEAIRQGRLILIAEDHEINQKVIMQQLALLGQTADIANNGRDALERWQSGDYALVFADLHMPKMDGYELTAAIRAAEKNAAGPGKMSHVPIIAFTANALKGEAEHCLSIGMDDYLSKPVQLSSLKAMLERWLPVAAIEPMPAETAPVETAPSAPPAMLLPVDVNVLKALVGDNEATIRDLLLNFRTSAANTAAELRIACAARQATTAGALAHKLKSAARTVGALDLGELCSEMEKAGKAGDMDAVAVLLPGFNQLLASVESYLDGF